jgi:MFS transporter, DHA2 family, multidrug resistance protein
MSHGISDPATAQHQAIVALGHVVKRQALVLGFGDTFAIIGITLGVAAVLLLLARKGSVGAGASAAH